MHTVRLLLLPLLLTPVAASGRPRLVFGPNAYVANLTDIMVDLVTRSAEDWVLTQRLLRDSRGWLHLRGPQALALMPAELQLRLAVGVRKLGLQVSIGAGGALCQNGASPGETGARFAFSMLEAIKPYLKAGGTFSAWGIFGAMSRTHSQCPAQDAAVTILEVAAYATAISEFAPTSKLYLYDDLGQFSVNEWPPNDPSSASGLQLSEVLTLISKAMAEKGANITGFWADCPYECSSYYMHPNGTTLDGYARLYDTARAVRSLGLEFGKTFNSHEAGRDPDMFFYSYTMLDLKHTLDRSPRIDLDLAAVDSWYP
jgi:hypothetical protein